MQIIKLSVLVILTILMTTQMSFAQDASPVGTLVILEGHVGVTHQGEKTETAAKSNSSVYAYDQFMTGKDTVMEITFIDDTIIKMGAEGSLTIDEYAFDPQKPQEGKARYTLLKTAFMFASGLMAKNEDPDVELNLDFGSIGIRGTKIYRGMRNNSCWIFLEEGIIRVHNRQGYVTLDAGQGTRIFGEENPPTLPEHWSDTDYSWIKQELSE